MPIEVFVADLDGTAKLQYSFWPKSQEFTRPHIVRIHNNTVWVGEIAGNEGVLWGFDIKENNETVKISLSSSNSTDGNGFYTFISIFISIVIFGCR